VNTRRRLLKWLPAVPVLGPLAAQAAPRIQAAVPQVAYRVSGPPAMVGRAQEWFMETNIVAGGRNLLHHTAPIQRVAEGFITTLANGRNISHRTLTDLAAFAHKIAPAKDYL
jgi:hypothetical protein